jgi:hypothetical protein
LARRREHLEPIGASRVVADPDLLTHVREKRHLHLGLPDAFECRAIERLDRRVASQPDALLDKLEQLGELRDAGVLTEEEFEAQKARLLAGQ